MFQDPVIRMLAVALIVIIVGPTLLKFIWMVIKYESRRVSRRIRQWIWEQRMRRVFGPFNSSLNLLKKRINEFRCLILLISELEVLIAALEREIILARFDEVGI